MFNFKKRNTKKSRKKYLGWKNINVENFLTLGVLVIVVKLSIIRILEVLFRILDRMAGTFKNYFFLVIFRVPFFVILNIYHWIFLLNSPKLFLILGKNFSEYIQNYDYCFTKREVSQKSSNSFSIFEKFFLPCRWHNTHYDAWIVVA